MPIGDTALVILVPQADPVVSSFRNQYDPSAADGMPAHITILAPFVAAHRLDGALSRELADLFGGFAEFDFTLRKTAEFPGVLYLQPEPSQPFRDLIQIVQSQYPDCPAYGGLYPDAVPHLTVIWMSDPGRLVAPAAEFHRANPFGIYIRCRAQSIVLMAHRHGGWQQEGAFRLRRG